jgi:hypothetical protein
MFLGREIHITVDVPDLAGEPRPALARAVSVVRGGAAKAPAGLDALDAHQKIVGKISTVIDDRGYAQAAAENWAVPLWLRGLAHTFDLKDDQMTHEPGPRPGTIWVDGTLYTTAMPEGLWKLPRLHNRLDPADYAKLSALYEARRPYAFTPMGAAKPGDLTQRFRGPALAGKVRCPNTPASMSASYRHPETGCQPDQPCGCGTTITLGPEHHARERQRFAWGSQKWVADYGRRVAVESFNAELSTNRGALRRGTTRCLSANKTEVLLAIYIAATNTAMIRDWYEQHPDLADNPAGCVPKPSAHGVKRRTRRKPARHRLLALAGAPPG